jgi:hypothetical protein
VDAPTALLAAEPITQEAGDAQSGKVCAGEPHDAEIAGGH